jgi:hypothetical protein
MFGWMSSKLKQTTGHANPMPKKNACLLMVFPFQNHRKVFETNTTLLIM